MRNFFETRCYKRGPSAIWFDEVTINKTTEGSNKMKKMILIAALALTSFAAVEARESCDFLNSDGSATRITLSEDSWGRPTVSSEYVSRDQRDREELAASIFKAIVWLFFE